MTTSRALTFAACLLTAEIFAAAVPAATPVAPPPAQTTTADPFTQDLLRRLASTNTTEREAAQKQLAALAVLFDQTDIVQQLADATADAELKSLFQTRVNQIKAKEEEKRLTSLPGITLSLKTASLAQVLDALNKSLNTSSKFMTEGSQPNTASFDLDVKDKPFWEVFAALQDQQPLELSNNGNNMLRVMPVPSIGLRRYAIDGPAMVWVTNINYARSLNYRSPSDTSSAQPQLNIMLMAVIDPRIKATQFKTIKVTTATDDEGRVYRSNTNGGGYSSSGTNFFNQQLMVVPPERLGKTLNISFDSSVTTTVGDPLVTINDMQNNLNKQFTIGTRSVRITNFNTTNPTYAQFQLSVTALNESVPFDSNTRINYSILDATGRSLMSSSITSGSSSNSIQLQNSTPPYKIELRTPGRPLELPLHFDLKDLPLP